jgi:regulation of enolase protein 1 (concanavalin A-like superfamily)
MTRIVSLSLLSLSVCLALGSAFAEQAKTQNIEGWGTVVDPDGDCTVILDKVKLLIGVPTVPHDLTYRPDFASQNSPRVLQDAEGDFTIQVRVKAFPRPERNTAAAGGKFSFVGSGLLFWLDNKNFIRFERSAEGNAGTLFVWLERLQDGKSVTQKLTVVPDKDTYLQVERKGKNLSFAFKDGEDGQNWKAVQTLGIDLPQKLKVGVHAINTTTKVFLAQLEEFKLSSK